MQLFGYDVLSFEGRMNRKPYILIPIVLNIISWIIFSFIGLDSTLGAIVNIVFLLIGISFHVRRLHDLDKGALWCLLFLIPVVNFIFALYLIFCKGTTGSNQYGPDPLR